MAATEVKSGHYYRFCNKSSGKVLNFSTANGANVNVKAENGEPDQIWLYSTNRIYPESSASKCLTKSGGNGVTVANTGVASNQEITFSRTSTSAYGYYYHICINGFYLTQVGNGVEWTSAADGNNSIWLAEEIVKVTNIPVKGTEYFATWSTLNNGAIASNIKNSITNLYQKCFGVSGSDGYKYYNMYGAIYNGDYTSYKGKFHSGIDFDTDKSEVFAPVTGEVVYSSDNYGTVTIKENDTGRLFLCMHMTDRASVGKLVFAGRTVIGKVGGIGANGANVFDPHLHVEVHQPLGNYYGDDYQINGCFNQGDSVPVYDYF